MLWLVHYGFRGFGFIFMDMIVFFVCGFVCGYVLFLCSLFFFLVGGFWVCCLSVLVGWVIWLC